MKSNKILSLAIAAVLAGASGVAAAIDLSSTTATTPDYFAEELVSVESATAIKIGTHTSKLGSAVPTTAPRYLRIDLGGLKFDNDGYSNKSSIVSVSGNGTASFSSGAGAGQTHAIFSISAGNSAIADTETVTIDLTHEHLVLTGATPTLQYRMFETETCANNPTSTVCGTLYDTGAKQIVGLKSGIEFKTTPGNGAKALVAEGYKMFGDKVVMAGTGLGTVQLSVVSGVSKATGGSVSVSDILGASTKVTVKGDFSAAAQVWLSSGACPTGTTGSTSSGDLVGTIAADKQSATFGIGTSTSNYSLCFRANGDTPIPVSSYAADLVPAAAPGANISKISHVNKAMGSISRDGVILRSGFVSKFGIGVSRFIFANTGSQDANITSVRFFGNAKDATAQPALKATLPIVLKANSRTAIELADLVDLASMPIQNMMVEFNIGAQDDNIFGTYQLLLAGSTVQTVVPLERPVSAIK